MAQRIRGGVHYLLEEVDAIEMETLVVGLLRAAFLKFREARRHKQI
jgi:hypothetical protein